VRELVSASYEYYSYANAGYRSKAAIQEPPRYPDTPSPSLVFVSVGEHVTVGDLLISAFAHLPSNVV